MRLHVAAGARRIAALATGMPEWRVGDDVDRYVERLKRVPLRAGGFRLFAAHQMGTCRMGADPQTSVANPYGELHDTPGVWIGDASAFPTASGTNPMITIMALAHRTGEAIAAAARPQTRGGNRMSTTTSTHRPATSSTSEASGSIRPATGTIDVVNPTTEEVIGRIPEGTAEDVDRAVRRPAPPSTRGRRRRPTTAPGSARRSAPAWPSAATSSPR